jgi:N-acetyl-alpha-D-glucosaminyl L-malate synthase BshA
MKIGITCHPSAGGSGIMATELGFALADRGHTVHFVTSEPPFRHKEYRSNLLFHVVDPVSYPLFRTPPYSLALATKIADVAEEYDIDIWHAHYAIPNAAAAIFANEMLPDDKKFGIVTTLHGTDITLVGSDPSFFRVTKFAMERSCAVTAVSQWLNDETMREFKLERPVRTVYNFLDHTKFNGSVTNRCELGCEGEKIIMHISNFRPVKRVTDVVRVFKKVLEKVDATLVMVGEGPERMAAVGVAKQLGISDRIKYLGNYENVETIIPCADLVIQPSEHESFGLVPLEAMACKVPVIATASGGITEVIEHGISGYLCEVGDIEHMAQCAIEILTNETLARDMGLKGQERALTGFRRDDAVDQYEEVYREVMAMHHEGVCAPVTA